MLQTNPKKARISNLSVLIGHASISEKGTTNGTKGDSTGKEVCTRSWYSKHWDFMAVHPNAEVREKHAKAVEDVCVNDNVGYGQSDRNTALKEAKKVGYVISKIKKKCNCDCSSLQNLAALISGASGVTYGSNGWTTSSMKAALKAAGYIIIEDKTYLASADYCVRGAIYVKSGVHTVCGLSNGSKAQKTIEKVEQERLKIAPDIKSIKMWLNICYNSGLTVDTKYDATTKKALIRAWQYEVGLPTTGVFDEECQKMASPNNIKKTSTGILITIWQAVLICNGYDPNGIDGKFGSGCTEATKLYQKKNGLSVDGCVGKKTWTKAFS